MEIKYFYNIYIGQMLEVIITTRGHQRWVVDLEFH